MSQTVTEQLRELILNGEIAQGEAVREIATAQRLGVSRTPVRAAFAALCQDGLLEKSETNRYRVRELSVEDIRGATEVRAVLEGLAARKAAQRGVGESLMQRLQDCLDQGDALFADGTISVQQINQYKQINQRFHEAVIAASANPAIGTALDLNAYVPFASPKIFRFDASQIEAEYRRFWFAHQQHHFIVEAIAAGDAARAEGLMREHAHTTLRFIER